MKLAKILALLGLVLAFLTVPVTSAQADPIDDCDWVPLTFDRNYTSDGVRWKVRTRLRVYDLCEDGAIEGRTYVGPRNQDTFRDITPYFPILFYKRQNDRNYRDTGVDLDRARRSSTWHPWNVSTDDIFLNDGYFRQVRISWFVSVDGLRYIKSVTCERVETDGEDAYDCN